MIANRPRHDTAPSPDRVVSPEHPHPSDMVDLLRGGLVRRYQFHTSPDRVIGYSRLNTDVLGAGLVGFQTSPAAPANPTWELQNRGLRLQMDRPADAVNGTSMGYFATMNLESTSFFFERRFLLLATFRRPVREALPGFVPGDWAAALLVHWDGIDYPGRGVSCQFRTVPDANGQPTDRTRLNFASPNNTLQRNNLEETAAGQAAAARIRSTSDPSNFALALRYDRSITGLNAFLALFVDGEVVDYLPLDFADLANTSVIKRVSAGIGSMKGAGYRAQLDLIDLQMWT